MMCKAGLEGRFSLTSNLPPTMATLPTYLRPWPHFQPTSDHGHTSNLPPTMTTRPSARKVTPAQNTADCEARWVQLELMWVHVVSFRLKTPMTLFEPSGGHIER